MSSGLLALLHLCDSLFPIGAFAHSDGLETATVTGRILSGDDLSSWLATVVAQPLRCLEGPAVARAWGAFHARQRDTIGRLDAEVHALRPSLAGREATRAMGTRLIRTWMRTRPDTAEALRGALQGAGAGRPPAAAVGPPAPAGDTIPAVTLPVAFGLVCAASAIAREEAVQGYLYTRLSATVSAALRLMPLGQHEGHRLLADALSPLRAAAIDICQDEQPLGAFTPLQDIASMTHQYLHSRLFRS